MSFGKNFLERHEMFSSRVLILLVGLGLLFSFTGQMCTKAIVYGKNYDTPPKKIRFQSDRASVFSAVEKTLQSQGYQIVEVDESRARFVTGFRAVESDSHYFNLFGRKDYGLTDSAYYRVTVDMIEEGSKVKVLVSTTIKTVIGKLESSGKVENRILTQVGDLVRSREIQMSNVGIESR